MPIVYSTSFVAETTQSLSTWSSDWFPISTSSFGEILVNAVEDAAEIPHSNNFGNARVNTYRLVASGVPTGDQRIDFSASSVQNTTVAVMARMPTDNTNNGYVFGVGNGYSTDQMAIWRRVNGTDTLLQSASIGVWSGSFVVDVVGTNPVQLSMSNGTTQITFADSDAARHQSGTPGMFGRQGSDSTATSGFIYEYSVESFDSPNNRRRIILVT